MAGIQEGSEFGIQTAFQRYIALGIILGRVSEWRREIALLQKQVDVVVQKQDAGSASDPDSLSDNEVNAIKKHIERSEASLDSLEKLLAEDKLPMSNDDADVAKLEAILRKAKSKAKIISASFRKFKAERADGQDPEKLEAPLEFNDGRITQMLKPVDQVIEEFRI